jgi:hypothetical protein
MDQNEMSNLYRAKRIFHRCFLPSFGSFVQAVSEEEIFRLSSIVVVFLGGGGGGIIAVFVFVGFTSTFEIGGFILALVVTTTIKLQYCYSFNH